MSAECERAFSSAGHLISPRKNRLGRMLLRPTSVCVLGRHSNFLDLQFRSLKYGLSIRDEQVNF